METETSEVHTQVDMFAYANLNMFEHGKYSPPTPPVKNIGLVGASVGASVGEVVAFIGAFVGVFVGANVGANVEAFVRFTVVGAVVGEADIGLVMLVLFVFNMLKLLLLIML